MSTNNHTPITGSAFGLTTANLESPLGELDAAITALQAGGAVDTLAVTDATELTISSGAVTATQTYHTIDTESDASSDDLTDINGVAAGEILIISANNASRTVVVKHNASKIYLAGEADVSLDEVEKTIIFISTGTILKEMGRFEASVGEANPSYAKLSHEPASGTNGGEPTSAAAWEKRTLDTEYDPDGIVTLASSVFTLAAGTYRIMASAPGLDCNSHRIRLRNTTDSSDVLYGTTSYTTSANYVQTRTFISGEFTIADTKSFEIQHYVGAKSSVSNQTWGSAASAGIAEQYAVVDLWKMP